MNDASYRSRKINNASSEEDMTLSPNLDEPRNALLTAMSSPLLEEDSPLRTTTVTFQGVEEPTTFAVAKRPASHHQTPSTTRIHGVQGPTSTRCNTVATHGDNVLDDNGTTSDPSLSHHDLWKMIDRELRTNMGNSVRCGICLSTLTNPIMTPCVHAYCHACLTTALRRDRSPKCPECNQPITKRSCQPYPFMNDLAKVYKELLQDFGLTPSERDPTFTTLTQAAPSSEEEDERNDEDDDDDDHSQSFKIHPKNRKTDTKQRKRLERSQVSKTWQLTLEQVADVEPIFMAENAKVVAANERAVQQQQEKQKACAGVEKPDSESADSAVASTVVRAGRVKTAGDAAMATLMTPGQASRRPPHPPSSMTQPRRRPTTGTTTETSTAASIAARRLYASTPSPAGSAFPNTQDIIEQAQEQQAADRSAEWLEDDDNDFVEPTRSPRNSTSFLFPQSAEESNSTNPSPPSPTPTFGTAREEEESQDAFSKLQQQQQSQVYGTPADLPSQTTMDVGEARLSVPEPQDEKEEEEGQYDKETSSSREAKHGTKISIQKGSLQTNMKRSSAFLSSSPLAKSPRDTELQIAALGGSTAECTAIEAPTPRTSTRSAKATTQSVATVASKQALANAEEPQLDDHDSKPEAAKGASPPPRPSRESATAHASPSSVTSEFATDPITIGTIVTVQPRTWPGVNKQGGVARITKVYGDGSSYNVSYILGGRESNVDAIFVRQDDNGKSQRRRVAAPAATITATAPRAAAAFIEELPADLLATLAHEGFDTGVRQASINKRKGQSAGGEQQEGRNKRASSLVSSLDVKRSKSAAAENSSSTKSRRNSSSTTTTTTNPTTNSNRRRPFQDVANQNSTASKRTKTATGKKSTTTAASKRKSPKEVFAAAPTTAASDESPSATATTTVRAKKQKVAKNPGTTATKKSGKGEENSTRSSEEVVKDSNGQLCGLADTHYAKYVEKAIRNDKVVYVVASNLEDRDADVLQALCRKTHGSNGTSTVDSKWQSRTALDIDSQNFLFLTPSSRSLILVLL
jgi:hypothetical protein